MADFEGLIPLNKEFVSPGRTISEGDFTLLANLTWNTTVTHTNKEYMKNTEFGERILDGPSILACATGLSHRSGYYQATNNANIRPIANLGYENVRFLAPVKPGDTITVSTTITGYRVSEKNPERRAILSINDIVYNQKGERVLTCVRSLMVESMP